ncbi:DNA polymerase IV [Roseivirga sp. BDSF3-8]|uniref:DNA polymerase IV n=1 Tax=Roseivirga sp. BDSF3-8 TaxID=3241598 RepID=UPI00353261DD
MMNAEANRSVIHMDLDAFFVSVECLRDNRLKHKPLIIGGTGDRGVVASCSYEARHFGVHSAMPVKMALQLCPDAIVIKGDMEAYSRYSHLITEIISDKAPLFEKSSIDEFYLDVSGMDRFFGCYKWGTELRQTIMKESGLTISMGLSGNKMVSKIATGECKPNGQREIVHGTEGDFLAPLPVKKIPLIGKKTARLLNEMGIVKVATLREMPDEMLRAVFGNMGPVLKKRAHGIDDSPVEPYSERKSISTEHTFSTDTIDVQKLKASLIGMVEKIGFKMREQKKLTSCLTVKLRYSNFDTVSRQLRIPYTSSDDLLIAHALELFDKLYNRRMLIRLLGVRVSSLVHGQHQIHLFEETEENIRLHQALDSIKYRYGPDAVCRAVTAEAGNRMRFQTPVFTGDVI